MDWRSPEQIRQESRYQDLQNWVTTQGGDPYAIEDPVEREHILESKVWENQFGSIDTAQHSGHVQFLESLPGMTPEILARYRPMIDASPELATMLINQAAGEIDVLKDNAYRAEQEQQVTDRRNLGLADIEGLQGQGDKLYGDQINRIQGFLDNPSSIRSDAQLGKRLTEVESLLAGQLGEIRKGAAKTTSQAGLRAAGKIDTGVRAAEQNATAMQGKNISGLLGELGAEKTSLGTQQLGFNAGLTQARDTVRGGGIADLANLRSQAQSTKSPDYAAPEMTGYDIKGLGYSKEAMDNGMWMQLASMLMQQGQNDKGSVMQLLGGLGGK